MIFKKILNFLKILKNRMLNIKIKYKSIKIKIRIINCLNQLKEKKLN